MTDTQDTPLLLHREGAIATLTFHRPAALNAIDVPMALALRDAVRTLAQDRALRCVVLEGAAELLAPLNEAVALLGQLDAPVIAKVHGAAAGAGLSLMLQADFVYAAEGTRFNLAYINLGASCDVGASWALPRIVGLRNALEIAMLGETLDCAQAQRLSLINRVLPPAELDAAVQQLAQRLAAGPTVALGHMRRLMRAGLDRSLRDQLAAEACAFDACARTADLPRGIAAFHAKQAPQFEGR